MEYTIEEYESIISKLRQMLPYSNGITISGEDTMLLWDKDWHIEICKDGVSFTITLKRVSEFFNDAYYREFYKYNYFEDKRSNYPHLIENRIIGKLLKKRFYQVKRDYKKGMKEVYEL